jgi:hypothetical protein
VVVQLNGTAMPADCAPRNILGGSGAAAVESWGADGTPTADGSALEVIGPNQNGASSRSFSFSFTYTLATLQQDGLSCGPGMFVKSIELQSGANGLYLNGVTPSTPHDIVNVNNGGEHQSFSVTISSLDGNWYDGSITLLLSYRSDGIIINTQPIT